MDTAFNFTKRQIESIENPSNRKVYRDKGGASSVQGLCLYVSPNGKKVFRFEKKVLGKNIKVTLGNFPQITIEQARQLATTQAQVIAAGGNPNQQKKEQRELTVLTFDDLFEIYIASFELDIKSEQRRTNSLESNKRIYRQHIKPVIGQLNAETYTKAEARTMLNRLFSKTSYSIHNHALSILKSMYNRADMESSPFSTLKKIDESVFRRERTLSKDELDKLLWSLDQEEDIFRDCVLMLLFTGQRKSNVLSMRWDEIDHQTKVWTIPLEKIKTKKPHVVPLSNLAMEVLERRSANAESGEQFVFPSTRSKCGHITSKSGVGGFWHRITERAGLYVPDDPKKHLRIHDLRRTLATNQVSTGGSLQATSKLLGHSNIGITNNVYAHLSIKNVRDELEQTTAYMFGKGENSALEGIKKKIDSLSIEDKRLLLNDLIAQVSMLESNR